ncbi:hypothetical protein C3486_04975 [Streptomyces sp. Ru73]|uniref:DUF6415 family natural product biosynthesis protein n=1 Tax=Streptomyces sp. Ru73 TaxID=2080748 RepID=UPI000CDDE320|nr:DUF6415 family natural product biosynthesis protein [Streptomyces sp. Ru73]POX42365.1 hypothetical protein C3486_04975 [Streptomyces sp. Ru73]
MTAPIRETDVRVIAENVARGLGKKDISEDIDRVTLDIRLRDHIAYLVPQLRRKIDGLWRGSPEWSLMACQLDVIKRRVAAPTPAGDRAIRLTVMQLAQDCAWLLEQCGKGERS